MRSHFTRSLFAMALLIACGEAGPVQNEGPPPAGDGRTVPAGKDDPPSAGPRLQCDSLDGLVYAVTYYTDNRADRQEVLRFVNGKMICDGCPEQGVKPGMFNCTQAGPDSVQIKTMMMEDAQLSRRYAFTLTREGIDGKADIKGEDGEFITQPFAGQPAP